LDIWVPLNPGFSYQVIIAKSLLEDGLSS